MVNGRSFLAHLSRRLTRWAYSIPMVCRLSVVVRCLVVRCLSSSVVVHTFKLEYLWSQLANLDQISFLASLGWGKGCIRFWGRLDQNSGVHGNRKPPLTYNGENDVSTFLCPQLWRSWRGILVSSCPCVRVSIHSRTVHARVLEKYLTHVFFSCPSYLPFWSYAPLKKSEWNLMHAISYEPCMLGFWYMGSSWKNSWPVFCFLSELSPFLELCPFEKIRMKSCQQDISKSIWARGLKLGQLIGDDE